MNEVKHILSINTLDGLLNYGITVRTILIVGIMPGLIAMAVVLYFGGIKKTNDYFTSKINLFFNTYVDKNKVSGGKLNKPKIDKISDKISDKNV